MRVEWNEDTNKFDFFDVTVEQANELCVALELLCTKEQLRQDLEGTPEFKDVVASQLDQIFVPIVNAMQEVPADADLDPCQCFNCIINNILKIRESAPFN